MIKFKHILFIAIAGVLLYACSNGGSSVDNFNHEAQAVIDNDTLVDFLKKHYYDEGEEKIKPLVSGQIALFDNTDLITRDIKENDIDYKLYILKLKEGDDDPVIPKGFPNVVDSVYVKYEGHRIIRTDSLAENNFDKNTIWFRMDGVIRGWTYGIANTFKGGENITDINNPDNGNINYINGGKGILFIPSGLAYRNTGTVSIPGNSNLVFYVNLWDLYKIPDADRDNIDSLDEDLDGDGKPWNDNSDDDSTPDYLDTDDDNDGVLTKYEDANGNGDPRDDFSDPDNPTVPDYLNSKIKNSTEE